MYIVRLLASIYVHVAVRSLIDTPQQQPSPLFWGVGGAHLFTENGTQTTNVHPKCCTTAYICRHEAFSAPAMRAVPLWEIQGFSRDPSYHGVMKGKEAEDMLKEHDRDHYLTRYSEARSKYVLTIKRRDQVVNFDLGIETGEHGVLYEIVGTDVKFGELRKLLDFYRNNPVSHQIRGIGDYLISDNYVPNDSVST